MRPANRFFLAAAAVLAVACAAVWFLLRLDATGVAVESAVLGGILLLVWPAAWLVARSFHRVKVSERESSDLRVLFDGLDDGLAFIDREGLALAPSFVPPASPKRWLPHAVGSPRRRTSNSVPTRF